jgi:hypothetical protein
VHVGEPSTLLPLPVPQTFGVPASAPAMGAPQTPASHWPHCTVPPQNLSKTIPQLAPSWSHVEGQEAASGVLTVKVKLESSPLLGMPLELEPLAVASGPDDELPLVALVLPDPLPKSPASSGRVAAHPNKVETRVIGVNHAPSCRIAKRSM